MVRLSSIPLTGGGVVETWAVPRNNGGDFLRVQVWYENHRLAESSESAFNLKVGSFSDDDYTECVENTVSEFLDDLGVSNRARSAAIDAVMESLAYVLCRCRCDLVVLEVSIEVGEKGNHYQDVESEIESLKLDQSAGGLVLTGAIVKKHTKGGDGFAHNKFIRMVMVGHIPTLQWTTSRKYTRMVICKEAHVGPSPSFQNHRRRNLLGRGDAHNPGLFGVVTIGGEELHFECPGGLQSAQLWVRGIRLLNKLAIKSSV